MYKILAIVGSEVANGFVLAGIDVAHTKSYQEAKNILASNISNDKYGVIIIEETLYENLDLYLKKIIDKGSFPLVVPLPIEMKYREDDHSMKSSYISQLLKRTIGYNIKIN
ncbi:MAG: V-type ATP synthase subunit F [bacterium]|nr:V-type ATP synthase subunit F [bacterium]